MGLWWFMLIMDALFIPGLMMLAGWCMWKHAPKTPNCVIGYRTARSMRSPEAWAFAQVTCGRLWVRVGAVLLVVSTAAHLPLMHASESAVSTAGLIFCFAEIAVMIATIFPVERQLKERFGGK